MVNIVPDAANIKRNDKENLFIARSVEKKRGNNPMILKDQKVENFSVANPAKLFGVTKHLSDLSTLSGKAACTRNIKRCLRKPEFRSNAVYAVTVTKECLLFII